MHEAKCKCMHFYYLIGCLLLGNLLFNWMTGNFGIEFKWTHKMPFPFRIAEGKGEADMETYMETL